MTNQQLLEDAKILPKDTKLTHEQEDAIKSLSDEEIKVLISVKKKLIGSWLPEELAFPITHHH